MNQSSIYRVLDASLNRASEGLRVVEDFLRLGLDDANLCEATKRLRHALTQATAEIDSRELIFSRDSQQDVGRTISTDEEFQRGSEADLVQSNLSRVQQALRTIEEYGKTISASFAFAVEQLRYETYTLEKAILTTTLSLRNLEETQLCVLIDGCSSTSELTHLVEQLLSAGVDLIQLREKRLTDRDLMVAGLRLTELTRGTSTRWIMNDRVDLALSSGADGVHLGQDDLHVSDARRILGANRLIGVSTHSMEQARQAVMDGANYIGVGPTFVSNTKQFDAFPGLEFVRQVSREIQLPAFAIGGIHLGNVQSVVQSGLRRVAVRNGVVGAKNPQAAAAEFARILKSEPLRRNLP